MYNYNQEFYKWDEIDFDSEPAVPRAKHKTPGEALYSLMEQLYDSKYTIDVEYMRRTLAYLCDQLDCSDELLQDPKGLCVKHYRN